MLIIAVAFFDEFHDHELVDGDAHVNPDLSPALP